MNFKLLNIGAVILALIGSHWLMYNLGRSSKLAEIMALPVQRDTSGWRQNRSTMPTDRIESPARFVTRGEGRSHELERDSLDFLGESEGDELPSFALREDLGRLRRENLDLMQDSKTKHEDSYGGAHDITYSPFFKKFTEDYTPILISREREITESKNIPIDGGHDWFASIDLLHQTDLGVGLGGSFGRQPIAIRYGIFEGHKPMIGISAYVSF
jgi:hypothetical protein